MRTPLFLTALLLALTSYQLAADDFHDFNPRQGLLFHASYDNTIDAVFAAGNKKGYLVGKKDKLFVDGIKGKGFLAGTDAKGNHARRIRYQAAQNVKPGAGTLLIWFKPLDWKKHPKKYQHLVSFTGPKSFLFYHMANGKVGLREGRKNTVSIADLNMRSWQDGQWHHFAAVWEKNTLRLHIDGKLIKIVPRPANFDKMAWQNILAGALSWGNGVTAGSVVLDELRIYDRPLTGEEILFMSQEFGQVFGGGDAETKITSGRSKAIQDGRITPGEYAVSNNIFFRPEGSYYKSRETYYLGHDDKYIYAAMTTFVGNKPRMSQTKRDGDIFLDETLEFHLLAGETQYQIMINPRGAVYDARLIKNERDKAWNFKDLKIGCKVVNGIWTCEAAIPLAEILPSGKNIKFLAGRCFPDPRSPVPYIVSVPVRKTLGFSDKANFAVLTLDPAAPRCSIRMTGDLNAGELNAVIKAPDTAEVRMTYATDKIWLDERRSPQKGTFKITRGLPPDGQLTASLRWKNKVLWAAGISAKSPSPLRVSHIYTDRVKQRLHISLLNESGQPGGRLLAELRCRKTGKTVQTRKIRVKTAVFFLDESMDVKKLAPGDYDFFCYAVESNGSKGKEMFTQFFRKPPKKEAWRGNRIGIYPGEVPPPWVPIKAQKGVVDTLMQSYRFSNTLLPSYFGTHKKNLFSRPARLFINKKPVTNARFTLLKNTKEAVFARTEGRLGPCRVTVDYKIEYDGMIWMDLVLEGKKVRIDSCSLEFALIPEESTLVHNNFNGNIRDVAKGGNGLLGNITWRKNLYDAPAFWVGGDNMGFCWFAEHLKNWKNNDSARAMEIVPGKNERIVRLFLIDTPVVLNGKRHYEFGIQGSPVKPSRPRYDVNFWNYYNHGFKYFDYHDSSPEFFDMERIKKMYNYTQKMNRPFFYYVSSNGFAPYGPEWAWYVTEWISGQVGRYTIESIIRTTAQRNRSVWTFACLNCKSFFDYKIDHLAKIITEGKIPAPHFYYDLVGPRLCSNKAHGCGWVDSNGSQRPTFPVRAVREFQKRLYHLSMKKDVNFMHVLHITGRARLLPVNSFAAAVVDGESFYGGEVPEKENYYSIFTPEMFRAGFQTNTLGYDMVFIPQLVRSAIMTRPDRVKYWRSKPPAPAMLRALRHFNGYALVHNVFIWIWDNWSRDFILPLRSAQTKHLGGNDGIVFYSYWMKDKPYTVESTAPARVMVSMKKKGAKGVLYVFNDTDQDRRIAVDFKGLAPVKLVPYEKEFPGKLQKNKAVFNIRSRDCCIYFVTFAAGKNGR